MFVMMFVFVLSVVNVLCVCVWCGMIVYGDGVCMLMLMVFVLMFKGEYVMFMKDVLDDVEM